MTHPNSSIRLGFMALVLCALITGALSAQEPQKEQGSVLRQDKKALALMARADQVVYSAKAAGLRDLSYRHQFEWLKGVSVQVKWSKDGGRTGDLVIDPTVDKAMKTVFASNEAAFVAPVLSVLDLVIGKSNVATYANEEIHWVDDDTIKVVAKTKLSLQKFQSVTIDYDARGLPSKTLSKSREGEVLMEVKYVPQGKHFLIDTVSSKMPGGTGTMHFSYQKVGGFHLPSQIESRQAADSKIQKFLDMKVNQGAAKAPTSRPKKK